MYHYVREGNPRFPYFRYLSIHNFKQQLDYFDKEFGFVEYEDLKAVMAGNGDFSKLKNKVILTFDDGFTDHYEYVFPELEKRNLFGVFYIPTGVYSDNKPLDVHRIQYLMGKVGAQRLLAYISPFIDKHMLNQTEMEIFNGATYKLQNNDKYTQEFKKIFNYYIKYEFRTELLDKLVLEFSSDDEIMEDLYMPIAHLREMKANKMIIGSHSVNHRVFSKLAEHEQHKEIHDSFAFLDQHIGKSELKTFCYPYGGYHTFTDYTETILSQMECAFSFNVEQRDVLEKDLSERPQALPRYDCNQFKFGESSVGT